MSSPWRPGAEKELSEFGTRLRGYMKGELPGMPSPLVGRIGTTDLTTLKADYEAALKALESAPTNSVARRNALVAAATLRDTYHARLSGLHVRRSALDKQLGARAVAYVQSLQQGIPT